MEFLNGLNRAGQVSGGSEAGEGYGEQGNGGKQKLVSQWEGKGREGEDRALRERSER